MFENAVAVTATEAITALGVGVDALWQGLLDGRRPFSRVKAFGVDGCRAQLAAEVAATVPDVGADRSAGLAMLAAGEALASRSLLGRRVGIVVGSAGAGTDVLESAIENPSNTPTGWWRRYQKRWLVDELSRALTRQTGITVGPSTVINTACSSGVVAIALGMDWLRAGSCDCVLAIGTDELGRFTYSGFHALRAIDPELCRPFDKNRRGMSMGEGAGCVVLERVRDVEGAGIPVHGYILGAGLACDAHHLTAPDPAGIGAARALTLALEQAGIQAEDVGFVNAHGTGTPLNDAAEVVSLERVLGKRAQDCPVHSVKATTGHCMGAAGTIEAIVALKTLETGVVPATAGLRESDFEGRVRCIQDSPAAVEARFGVSTNFGFGGNDAALVLSYERR